MPSHPTEGSLSINRSRRIAITSASLHPPGSALLSLMHGPPAIRYPHLLVRRKIVEKQQSMTSHATLRFPRSVVTTLHVRNRLDNERTSLLPLFPLPFRKAVASAHKSHGLRCKRVGAATPLRHQPFPCRSNWSFFC